MRLSEIRLPSLLVGLIIVCFLLPDFADGQERRRRRDQRPDAKAAEAKEKVADEKPAEVKADSKTKKQEDEKAADKKKSGVKKPEEKPKAGKPQAKKAPAKPKVKQALDPKVADAIKWRSIGPANMGGRITAIAVYEKDPSTWWAATASGGLLKTENNGNTFEHQFDDQATVSIGDVQVAQSNKDIVWVGTGESNPRNSVSWGDGVYKSVDGGKTWKNMGLKETFQTGALAIHPENPDVVWVGSLGRLWGANPERGLFKTTDGGKTWKKTLYINDKTGVIDVQVNPKNPDDMLVATYERKRDGFDGNDPMQRFGEGAGIYRSTDGGESFMRVTEGLPSCKMGRIGLDYFEADPNVVVAVVESEKIAKAPEKYSFVGIRGENADVGARLTNVTDDGPADKAGMKEDDIVVSLDGNIIASYSDFLLEVHKHQAGETVKVVVSRDRKLIDVDLELGSQPKRSTSSTRTRRTDFTGTLGGQSANRQDTQGPDGHEYGGVYQSEDGGTTWKRINSLNPRPMYYSNIQIDPVDRNNIYVCGTSLYKSKDGGETFTGDGGSDGIHVDHHALWLDKNDPRHMILGNDGGVHVTYDRMTHWDHLNHVAIGQFYHVGVDSNLDYKVYGGLQDNGSWGGPSRGASGSGPVNNDWFNVGGGDGFITLADPEDPNQLYYESQNGGMGRIHLETGERGFSQPRERGQRFRFNWKTPYMLSPHNSKMFYSAGNYVFRSFNKGDKSKRISPEITNHTDKGAGSAISESPVEAGVMYVGTTDGAVWVTKDGGNKWEPLFYSPVKKEEEKKEENKKENDKKIEGKSEEGDPKNTVESAKEKSDPSAESKGESDDVVSGNWEGQYSGDRIPEDRASFEFKLKLTDGKITGEIDGRRGPQEISSGKYDSETGDISFLLESERGEREYTGKLKDGKITGEMVAGGGRFTMEFEATKAKKEKDPELTALGFSAHTLTSAISFLHINDDELSGIWDAIIEDEDLPGGRLEFSIDLKVSAKKKISGRISSVMGELDIVGGSYNEKKQKVAIEAENDEFQIEIIADIVNGTELKGTLEVGDGQVKTDVQATKREVKEKPAEKKKEEKKVVSIEEKKQEKAKPAKEKKTDRADAKAAKNQPAQRDPDDKVSGTWKGVLISPRGEQDLTLVLKRKSNDSISGTFESTQGERDISQGSFDPEANKLTLMAETDQFTIELSGDVEDDKYEGELDINSGSFTMEFKLEKSAETSDEATTDEEPEEAGTSEKAAEEIATGPTGEGTLASFLPGPRWVSSIEASHFKAERCYMTFDGHRSNDDGVYVFVTNDYGKTWKSIQNNVPDSAGSVRVLREDLKNENLLFLGCEFASFYSIDAGASWTKIKGLPTVSVHEFAIHPKAEEVVAGTHGRSLWIADISILRQLSKEKLAEDVVLYDVRDAIRWQRKRARGSSGTRKFVGENPSSGVSVAYSLGKNARRVKLEVLDLDGDTVKTFETQRNKGLHVLAWDLSRDSEGQQGRFRQGIGSGEYRILLKVDGEIRQTKFSLKPEPGLSDRALRELELGNKNSVFTADLFR